MKDLLIKANGWDNKEMDLEYVFIRRDKYMWEVGLMIYKIVMEEWFMRITIIILDIGCKESIMVLELLLVLNYIMKELGKMETKYF